MKAVLVEDEPLARQRLRRLLVEAGGVEIVAEATDAAEAIAAIKATAPDIVFLDIRLPDGSGFDVLAALPLQRPLIVFVTAYDQFAVRAFEIFTLDYLLKPFGAARVNRTLARARRLLLERSPATADTAPAHPAWGAEEIRDVIDELRREASALAPPGAATVSAYLDRLAIRVRDRRQIVPVTRVDRFTSADNYVEIHYEGRTHLLRRSLASLEEVLDPTRFVRIHRRTIVRIESVACLRMARGGDLCVEMHAGELLRVGRAFRARVEATWPEHG